MSGPEGRPAQLEELPLLLAAKELELAAQGFPPRQVAAATSYVWRRAAGVASKAAPAHQEATFISTFQENLQAAGRWLEGNQQAVRDGDMAHGVDRAVREDRQGRGYRRMGLDAGEAVARWAAATPESKRAYADFFS